MSLLPHEKDTSGRTIVCAVAFACFGSFLILNSFHNVALFSSTSTASRIPIASKVLPRTAQHQAVPIGVPGQFPLSSEVLEELSLSRNVTTPVYSAGVIAMFGSVILAAAGVFLRILAHLRPQPAKLNFVEMFDAQTSVAMLAAAAEKKTKQKVLKLKKVTKAKKEPSPDKKPFVLHPSAAKRQVRDAGLRKIVPKGAKTRGRVCMLLDKKDNRKARHVSFSHIRTHRLQKVNLHWRRLWWEEGKSFVRLRLSTKAIRTITKYGLHHASLKFGLDLNKHLDGISERGYVKYLPEKEKKAALARNPKQRYWSLVRMAKFRDEEPPVPPKGVDLHIKKYHGPAMSMEKVRAKAAEKAARAAAKGQEPAVIAMAISHGKKIARLARPADQRKALLRSLTTELIRHGRIKTTFPRARAMRKPVDHMITLAKEGSLHARRQALGYMYDKQLVHALFEKGPERFGQRAGGYTRIFNTMPRKGDAAKMCIIELVD